jgi:CelD/BcsL family acetyltransferase involved in cellulose biosynthesis
MRVAATTWQNYMGLGLEDTTRTRGAFRFSVAQGWLRIYVLYLKGIPCAFLVGQLYNGTFHCEYAGYNPTFTHLSVGSLLTARAFEHLAATGVQRVDLGEGGQEHNRRLGCQMTEEGTVHVYSATLRGVWLNLFFGSTHVARRNGRRVRSAFSLNRLSRFWGRSLTRVRSISQRARLLAGKSRKVGASDV